jgi:hypothetical protein
VQNRAAQQASCEVLIFLEDAAMPMDDAAFDQLLLWVEQPEIGAVGGRVFNDDGTHASGAVALAMEETAGILFAGQREHSISRFGHSEWYRNVSAVGSACLAIARQRFAEAGGFSEDFEHSGGDVDLCLRLIAKGHRIVYNPLARFTGANVHDPLFQLTASDRARLEALVQERVGPRDPYFNSNLYRESSIPRLPTDEPDGSTIVGSSAPFVDAVLQRRSGPGVKPDSNGEDMRGLVSRFDFSSQDLIVSRSLQSIWNGPVEIRTVNWFIPDFHHASYGGIHTILRLANHLHVEHQVENRFCAVGHAEPAAVLAAIAAVFPALGQSTVHLVRNQQELDQAPLADVSVATFWTTAYTLLKFNKTKRKFYMIQDCEPLFYPASSTSGQVEATYRFGFYGLCNTPSLQQIYERDYGGQGIGFEPNVDPTIFHRSKKPKPKSGRPYRVFFYGRPNNTRNAFELGTVALRQLKSRMGDDVQIFSAGEQWLPADFGLEGVVENLGILPIEETAKLYRACDAGLVLMFTRHPSYLPFEFMACGCLVVTNVNYATQWLLQDGENCLLSEASAACIASTLERGLRDHALRLRITDAAAAMVAERHSAWERSLERVFTFMQDPEADESPIPLPAPNRLQCIAG